MKQKSLTIAGRALLLLDGGALSRPGGPAVAERPLGGGCAGGRSPSAAASAWLPFCGPASSGGRRPSSLTTSVRRWTR